MNAASPALRTTISRSMACVASRLRDYFTYVSSRTRLPTWIIQSTKLVSALASVFHQLTDLGLRTAGGNTDIPKANDMVTQRFILKLRDHIRQHSVCWWLYSEFLR